MSAATALHGGPASSWEAQGGPEVRAGASWVAVAGGLVAAAAAAAGLAALAKRSREQRRDATARAAEAKQASAEACQLQAAKPSVEIAYCCKCKWGLRAAWMAQELLSTFEADLRSVNLAPSMEGGTYKITLQPSGQVIWDRRVDGGFPEAKEAKRRLRDSISPDRALGRCLDCK
ncbi:Hypothetical Protein FCC1311_008982 [Hondaea fermentalgiana]|uniref:Selenoprotein W n=1 Tax=Hondaea fermentalgiana TaxID=2315210 RepID=A0A2R5G0Z8_9STRA|nr:Hypothetical Protein FCC1311_008982 [Hondaea fermentalgiana]|eukprot:GBG24680.1 Hypothetical Protein FCC1311_008982 [Hondaea fermentalgiana]